MKGFSLSLSSSPPLTLTSSLLSLSSAFFSLHLLPSVFPPASLPLSHLLPPLSPSINLPLSSSPFLSKAEQLAHLYPRIYNCSVPATFSADLPHPRQCRWPQRNGRSRSSRPGGGETFVSFVKSKHFVDGIIPFYWTGLNSVTTVDRRRFAPSFDFTLLRLREIVFL